MQELTLQVRELQADVRTQDAKVEAFLQAINGISTRHANLAQEVQKLQEYHDAHALSSHGKPVKSKRPGEGGELVAASRSDITSHQLDAVYRYKAEGSTWDSCLFLGLPALGPVVSIITFLVYIINICVQLGFCWIVWEYMLEPHMTDETLISLLRFRVGTAHDIRYSDTVSRQSMASQICNDDNTLHMSGAQRSLYSNSLAFTAGGMTLSMLAQLLWLGYVIKEVNSGWSFARALLQLKRFRKTELIMTDRDGKDVMEEASGLLPSVYFFPIMVNAQIDRIHTMRVIWALLTIVVPRIVVSLLLGVLGVMFLSQSGRMDELVLNALALAFIMDSHKLFYSLFAPRRLQTLMSNLEPIPMPPLRRCISGKNVLLKMILVAGALFAIWYLLLNPFFWRLEQAQNILCSGDTNFVYATNPATGMVHVTRTQESGGWTEVERTILQVAHPHIERGVDSFGWEEETAMFGWDLDQEILDLSRSDFTMAVVTQTGMSAESGGVSLSQANAESYMFDFLKDMSTWDVGEMAKHMPCVDMEAGQSYPQVQQFLQQELGVSGFTCSMLGNATAGEYYNDSYLCAEKDMVHVRALCPEACGCGLGPSAATGFFGSVSHGCPQTCHQIGEVKDNFEFHAALLSNNVAGRRMVSTGTACADVHHSSLVSNASISLDCLTDSNKCLELDVHVARWYAQYVKGIHSYIASGWDEASRLKGIVTELFDLGLLGTADPDEFYNYTVSGGMPVSMLNGEWEFSPEVPHPRGLVGCEYLASYELHAILGVNLCSVGEHLSIRRICPVACACEPGMSECPAACTYVPTTSPNATTTTTETLTSTTETSTTEQDTTKTNTLSSTTETSALSSSTETSTTEQDTQ